MLEAQGRHPWRPAHVHFMIGAPGCEQLVTHLFVAGDQYLDSDVVFGLKDSLISEFTDMPAGVAADGRRMDRPHCHPRHEFRLKAHHSRWKVRSLDRDHQRMAEFPQSS